jgi:hypothetical protein
MFDVVVVLGVILLLFILVTRFRIGKLVGIVKGGSKRKEIRTSNNVNGAEELHLKQQLHQTYIQLVINVF